MVECLDENIISVGSSSRPPYRGCRARQAMIDVELLGFVYHYGLEVNSITVIREWVDT